MSLTTEQIEAILDGAPDGMNHIGVYQGDIVPMPNSCGDVHNLCDLREILELRQEVERLKSDLKIAMSVVDEVVQSAIECSNIEADDLQSWLVKEGVLKVVPFDPTKHYDYEHETKEGQDWVTWSDWYETKKEQSK